MNVHNNDIDFVNSISKGVRVKEFDGGYLFKFSDGTTSLSRWGTTDISFYAVECRANGRQTCIIQLSMGMKTCVVFGYDGKILGDGEFKRCWLKDCYPMLPSTAKSDYVVIAVVKHSFSDPLEWLICSGTGELSYSTESEVEIIPTDRTGEAFIPVASITDNGKITLINLISKKIIAEAKFEYLRKADCIYDEAKQKSPYILLSSDLSHTAKKNDSRIYDMSGNVIVDGLPKAVRWIHLEDQYGANDYLICSTPDHILPIETLSTILVMDEDGNFNLSKLNETLGLSKGRSLEIDERDLSHGLLKIQGEDRLSNFITSKETLLLDEWTRLEYTSDGHTNSTLGLLPSNLIILHYPDGSRHNIINIHSEEDGKLYEFEFDEPFFARVMREPIFNVEMTFLKYKGKENFFLYHCITIDRKNFKDLLCLDHWVDGIFIGEIDAMSGEEALFVKDKGKLFFLNTPKILCENTTYRSFYEGADLYECESVEYSKFLTKIPETYKMNPRDRFGYIFIYGKNKITILSVSCSGNTYCFDYNVHTADDIFDTNTPFPIIERNGKYAYLKPGYDIASVMHLNDRSILVTSSDSGRFFDDAQSAYCVKGDWYFPVTKDGENLIVNVWGYPVN